MRNAIIGTVWCRRRRSSRDESKTQVSLAKGGARIKLYPDPELMRIVGQVPRGAVLTWQILDDVQLIARLDEATDKQGYVLTGRSEGSPWHHLSLPTKPIKGFRTDRRRTG